jgi:hypothetical protein
MGQAGEFEMIGASLTLLVLLGQNPSPSASSDPASLVEQLGSGRYAERQAAASALERLGRRALPALRAGREVRDPEVRTRAGILIDKIEGALLTQPTLITLNFTDRTLTDVLKSFGEQAGIKMGLNPEPNGGAPGRRITLQETAPLPFWKAVDKLCEVAHLHHAYGAFTGFPPNREVEFSLSTGVPRPSGPVSDSGPFRVGLVRLHYERDVSFTSAGLQAFVGRRPRQIMPVEPVGNAPQRGFSMNEQFSAQLQITAEPRLSVSPNGPLKLIQAVDDRGQSLVFPDNGALNTQQNSGYLGISSWSALQLTAALKRPELPGKSITKLRGVVPVMVSTRKPGPLVIPLAGAAGKSFHNDDVTLYVEEIRANPNARQTTIELSVQPLSKPPIANSGRTPVGTGMNIHRPEIYSQQIEVVDSRGRPVTCFPSGDGEGSRMVLMIPTRDPAASPSELRYYAMSRATTEVSFAFEDLPMP